MKRMLSLILGAMMLALLLPAQSTEAQSYCSQAGRLSAGSYGRVTLNPNLPNRVRTAPGFTGSVIGQIPAGGVFYVNGQPQCRDGIVWWPVVYGELQGWTAEGNGVYQYWLEPYTATAPPSSCRPQPRLVTGYAGRVLPGLPNAVRDLPGVAAPSRVTGEIPAGGVFTVLQGPNCMPDGRLWWRVNYNGLIGWTAEGEANTYWLEPLTNTAYPQCPGALQSRLTAGSLGAVTSYPPLPNTVRAAPDLQAGRLGSIPVRGVFSVLSGPVCNDGKAWWQVRYGNLIGWTAESSHVNYWLEPR